MPNQQLVDFFQRARASGMTDEQIKNSLRSQGWQETQVQELFQPPVPNAVVGSHTPGAAPKVSSKAPRIIAIVAVVVLLLGGLAYAAYVFNVFPFGSGGNLTKVSAFATSLERLQQLEAATYAIELSARSEKRDENATSFDAEFTAEFDAEEDKYRRDQDRVNKLSIVLTTLEANQRLQQPYPDTLASVVEGLDLTDAAFEYRVTGDGSGYSITVTLETSDAVEAVKRYIPAAAREGAVSDGKRITITRDTFKTVPSSFYFSGKPKRPEWVQIIESQDQLLEFIPSDFSATVHAGGTTQKSETEKANASFQIGGEFNMGDLSVAADIEFLKFQDTFFGRINKFPSFFFDLASIKNKWVRITSSDVIGYDRYFGLDYFSDLQEEGSEKTIGALAQMKHLYRIAQEEKVLDVDYTVPNEQEGEVEYFVYKVTFNKAAALPFYERAVKEFGETYGEKAIIKVSSQTLEFLKSEAFPRYMDYLNVNTDFRIYVNTETGFPERFVYETRLVPSSQSRSKNQVRFTATVRLSNINKPVKLAEPTDFITFEDAQIAMTGQTKEEFRFSKQKSNVTALRSALSRYHAHAGVYPSALEELMKTPQEVPKGRELAPQSTTSGVQIDFPADFESFSAGGPEVPFMKVIPRDIYSGEAFGYTAKDDDYELTYTMNLEGFGRKRSESETAPYGLRVSVGDLVSVVDGANTATKADFSIEAKGALDSDSDIDGLPDAVERYYGSDANALDSDGDGFNDGDEVKNGYDPAGPGQLNYDEQWSGVNSLVTAREKAMMAAAKGTMNSLLPAMVLCQDSGKDIVDGSGKVCKGSERPRIGGVICSSENIGNWSSLPEGFSYTTCAGDTQAGIFRYEATNYRGCTITCNEKGCIYSAGCS